VSGMTDAWPHSDSSCDNLPVSSAVGASLCGPIIIEVQMNCIRFPIQCPLLLSHFNQNWNALTNFSKVWSFMKICSAGVALLGADTQMQVAKWCALATFHCKYARKADVSLSSTRLLRINSLLTQQEDLWTTVGNTVANSGPGILDLPTLT
jgi:hypothetical protein